MGEHWLYPEEVQILRMQLYNLFEEPTSSTYAQALSVFIMTTIIFATACFMLETMPVLRSSVSDGAWNMIELLCTIVFTIEYVIRFWVCDVMGTQSTCGFIRSPLNVFDFLAILPFYLTSILDSLHSAKGLRVFRAVRLTRLTRIFKLGRYSAGMRLMVEALKNSLQALWVLTFFLCIGVILFSSCMYYAEKMMCPESKLLTPEMLAQYEEECSKNINQGLSPTYGLCCDENDAPLDFPSIIAAFWWSFVTMTTVGFGDVYPRTWLGKVVGTFSMLSGILIIALPVAIVGRKFQEIYDSYAQDEKNAKKNQGDGISAILRAKNVSLENVPIEHTPLFGLSKKLRDLRLPEVGEDLMELAALFDESNETSNSLRQLEVVERYRQDEVVKRFERLLDTIVEQPAATSAAA